MSACSPSADELKNKIVDKVAAFLPHKAGTDEL
jgi:hypothetical protein